MSSSWPRLRIVRYRGAPPCDRGPDYGPPDAPDVVGMGGHLVVEGLALWANECGGMAHKLFPHAVERGLAEALAGDWWRNRPWKQADAWLPEALAAYYRNRYLEHAYDDKVVAIWHRNVGLELEQAPRRALVPLRGSEDRWRNEVGARFLEAVAHRIGETVFLEAMDRFHRSGAVSVRALQQELESLSRTALDDMFEPWVVAGIRPHVEGEWRAEGDVAQISLRSDVPFGNVAVPVVVESRRSVQTVWLTLVDRLRRPRRCRASGAFAR